MPLLAQKAGKRGEEQNAQAPWAAPTSIRRSPEDGPALRRDMAYDLEGLGAGAGFN